MSVTSCLSVLITASGLQGEQPLVDGQWLKKDALPPQDERTPSPPPQRDDSSALMNEVLSKLWSLHTYVGKRFDSLDGRFEGMDTHITQLEEDVSYLRRCFDLPPPS